MADLRLQVLLSTVDRATKPLRDIMSGSRGTARALQETRDRLKALNAEQRDIRGFQELRAQLRGTEAALRAASTRSSDLQAKLEAQRTAHYALAGNVKASRAEFNRLAGQMRGTLAPSAELNRAYTLARDNLVKLEARYSASTNSLRRTKTELKESSKEVQRLTSRKSELGQRLDATKQKLAAAGISTDRLAARKRQLRGETQAATAALRRYEEQLKAVGRARQRMERAHSAGMKIAAHGAGAFYLGQRGLRGMAGSLGAGIDFTKAMSQVQAVTRLEATDPRLAMLEAQARELGASSAFTATQAALGQGFLAMAGFSPDDIRDAMPAVLNTALAGDLALDRAADIISNIASAFGIEASETGRVADVLTAAFTTANVNLEMLGQTMKYVGPQARAMGVDLETATAMAGLLGNIGIQADMAGTTMREVLNRVSNTAGPAGKALESIGVAAKDSDGNLRNIVEIIRDVGEATRDMGTADRGALFMKIFGARPGAGMADLIAREGEGALSAYVDVLRDVEGVAARVAGIKSDNLAGDLNSLKSAAEDLSISLFKSLEPTLRRVTQRVIDIVRRIGRWVQDNPRLARGLALATGGLAALATAAGAVAIAVGTLLGPFAGLRYALTLAQPMLSAIAPAISGIGKSLAIAGRALLASPLGWKLAAIAAVAALIIKFWEPIKAFFAGLWEGLADGLRPLFEALEPLTSLIGDILAPALSWLSDAFAWLLTPADASAESLDTVANVGRAVGYAIGALTRPLVWIGELMGWLAFQVVDQLVSGWERLTAIVRTVWSGITTYLGGVFDTIAGLFTGDWQRMREGLQAQMQGIGTFLSAFFGELPQKMLAWGAALLDGLIQGIKSKVGAVKDAISGAAGGAIDWFKEKLGIHSPSRVFAELGQFTMQGFAGGLDRGQDGPLARLAGFGDQLRRVAAGLVLAPLAAPALAFDTRPPLAAAAAGASAAGGGVHIGAIHIHAAPGMDAEAIARAVRQEIERLERDRAARRRSGLYDYGD